MRNLKKVLSLVLALAMVLSICMVGASAVNYDDFTDEGEITKKQAVETLVSLDVIKGYNDGATFNPTGNVTRAEMATMICRILAGGDNMIVDATKPVPTYTDIRNNPSAAWAESYIEYCTSLGIVSGKGNGIFDPSADVTAAEAAKMVMTTLGYNADIEGFKGIGWDINVMAKANTLQLLNNLQGEISSSVPVTREQVAQLLFNALGAYTVQNYNGTTANTWIGSGANAYHETLLESKFNAEKITGVVIANEWADLYGEDPLGAGKTRVRVLGTDNMPTTQEYTVNLTTSLDQIGESIIVYRDTTSNRILFGNDQSTDMNVVNEFTAKGDITKSADFENAIDKNALTNDTEYFVNYGDNLATTAEIGRYFSIEMTQVTSASDTTPVPAADARTVYYRVGKELTSDEYRELQKIIRTLIRKEDDGNSFVYRTSDIITVGTGDNARYYVPAKFTGRAANIEQDTQNHVEYSDWNGFERYYLDNIEEYNTTKFTENQNGNYIKTVDYNNDGEIDFVLQTRYTVTNVDRIRNGDVTLYLDNVTEAVNAKDKIDTYMPFDELAEDDIVVYAVIDGVAHVYLTEMVTAKIDKVNRNKLTCTTTDGDEYVETGVDNNGVIDKALYYDDTVTGLAGGITYNLHFDRYGYLAAFTEAGSANFTLLVDGWFNYARSGREYAVKAYVDGEIVDRDVTRGGDLFIYDDLDNGGLNGLNNSWGLIKRFGPTGDINYTGNSGLKTILASLNEDGVLAPVDRLSTTTSNKRVISLIDTDKKVPNSTLKEGTAYSTGATSGTAYNVPGDEVEIRALNSTVYYYVYPSSSNRGNPIVREYTGYSRLPDLKEAEIEDVYAVGTLVNRDTTEGNRTYYTANVVVVEVASTYKGGAEEVLVVDTPVVGNGVTEDTLLVIRANGAMEEIQVDLSASKNAVPTIADAGLGSYGPAGINKVMPGLYKIYETDKSGVYEIEAMSHDDIRDSGRYAVGQVSTSEYTSRDQYVEVAGFVYNDSDDLHDEKTDPVELTVKDITDSSKLYTLSYDSSRWNATLEERTDWAEYMSEGVDRVNDSTGLSREFNVLDRDGIDTRVNANYNDVLIRYDKGNIVYAVSFANLISSRESTSPANTNAAQEVWDNVKPNPKSTTSTGVVFFGQTDWVGPDADTTTKDKSNAQYTIRVDYTDAKAWMATEGHKALTVDNVDYWLLSTSLGRGERDGQPDVTDGASAEVKYYLTFVDKNNKDYNYELILEEADHDSDLWYTAGKVNENDWVQVVPDEWEYTGVKNTLTNIMEEFKLKTGSTAEDPKWTFYAANGTQITNTNTSVLDGYYAKVVVTSEDGYDRTYTIYFGKDDNFLQNAMDAIDDKAFDVYFNTANGKVTFYKAEKDAAANTGSSYISEYASGAITVAAPGPGGTFNPGSFPEVAKAAAVQLLEAEGVTSLNDNRLSVGLASAVNANGGSAASDLDVSMDNAQTWITYTLGVQDTSNNTINAGIVVRAHYVNITTRNYGQAAKDLVDGMTPQVYYSEWHAISDGYTPGVGDPKYDKNGAAEYLDRDDAAGLVKPNGTTIFDLANSGHTSGVIGEGAAIATVNKALEDAGNELHIALGTAKYGNEDKSHWGPDKTPTATDVLPGDTYTRTATYALLDDNDSDSGLRVTITWTATAVVGAWNDGATYNDPVPNDYWE